MQAAIPPELEYWFAGRGWRLRRHQADMLAASDAGRHALLVADTGAGKTLAGFLPTLSELAEAPRDGRAEWGIDYLFGWVDLGERYTALWAHSFAEEKVALETECADQEEKITIPP